MKFILNEKYILDEGVVRYILNEETAEETIVNAVNTVIKKAEDLLNIIKADKTDYSKNKENSESLSNMVDEINLAEDPATVKGKIAAYLAKFKEVTGNRLNLYPDLNNKFKDITALVTPIDKAISKAGLANLKKEISDFDQMRLEASLFKTDNTEKNATEKALTDVIANLKRIKVHAPEVTQNTKEALQTKADLQTLYKALPVKSKFNAGSYATVQAACDRFNASEAIKKIINTETTIQSQKKDWASFYKKCQTSEDFEKFWNDYFTTEWAEEANRVRSFDGAFLDEIKNLGFDSINNPFIKYLKEGNRVADFNITKKLYPNLHNAVAKGVLSANDLMGTGKLKKSNLIFNKNLFQLEGNDFNEYLELQRRIIREADNLDDVDKEAFKNNPEAFVKNIMLADGNLNDLTDTNILAVENGQLRLLTHVKQKITELFGEKQEKINVTTDKLLALVQNVDEPTAKKMLAYLCDVLFLTMPNPINNMRQKIPNLVSTIDTTRPTFAEKRQFDNRLGLSYYKLSNNQLEDLIKELAKKAKIYNPEEK